MSEGGRERVNWMLKFAAKREVSERGGEIVYFFVESISVCEVGERGERAERGNVGVEFVSERELNERGREVVCGEREISPESKVGERGGEAVDWSIKAITKS